MSLKAKLKPYIFAFGLILGLVFFSNNALADNLWKNNQGYNSFLSANLYYDEDDILTADINTDNIDPEDINYGFTPYYANFFSSENAYGESYEFSIFINGDRFVLTGAICEDNPVTKTLYFGQNRKWCEVPVGVSSYKIHFKSLYQSTGPNLYYQGLVNSNGITKSDIDNYLGPTDSFETLGEIRDLLQQYVENFDKNNMYELQLRYNYPDYSPFPLGSSVIPDIDGACGSADNVLPVTVPIPNEDACSAGTVDNMRDVYSFDGIIFAWECVGSGEGITVGCESLPYPEPIDGACGSADGQSSFSEPDEEDKCSAGATNATTTITLTGWAWTCNGLYGGTDDACSSTYSGGGTPPEDIEVAPIPTPTDCESYSGIDEILCNIGNTIQGLFLPSTSKLIELQNTINDIGNVFPFNYLRAIGTVFTNLNFSSGTLTMTMFGNTETLDDDFWNIELFDNIKLAFTVLILLMFTFWALKYIKHFFK